MTFAQLKAEVSDRGFAHLNDTRLGQYVNRAIQRLDLAYNWPYREDAAVGLAPLSIPSLGQIEAVSNETLNYPIELVGYADLTGWGCDLSEVGSPQYAYRATPAGSPVVATWPTSASEQIGVQFWKITDWLANDADSPDTRFRYHMLIVDIAVQMAYRDSDNHQAAEALQVDIERQTAQMVDELISQQEPRFVRISDSSTDW